MASSVMSGRVTGRAGSGWYLVDLGGVSVPARCAGDWDPAIGDRVLLTPAGGNWAVIGRLDPVSRESLEVLRDE